MPRFQRRSGSPGCRRAAGQTEHGSPPASVARRRGGGDRRKRRPVNGMEGVRSRPEWVPAVYRRARSAADGRGPTAGYRCTTRAPPRRDNASSGKDAFARNARHAASDASTGGISKSRSWPAHALSNLRGLRRSPVGPAAGRARDLVKRHGMERILTNGPEVAERSSAMFRIHASAAAPGPATGRGIGGDTARPALAA